MSEEPREQYTPPEDQSKKKEWLKKRHVTEPVKAALLDLIEQTRIRKRPNITGVAARHGVNVGTLSQSWYRWKRGLIELGPKPRGQREVKMRLEMARTIDTCALVDQHLNDVLERKMQQVADAKLAGDLDAYYTLEVDKVLNSLMKSDELRKKREKGYLSLMDQRPEEKNVTPSGKAKAQESSPAAHPEPRIQRALEARTIDDIFGEPVMDAEMIVTPDPAP